MARGRTQQSYEELLQRQAHRLNGLGVGEEHSSHYGFVWEDRFTNDLIIEILMDEYLAEEKD